MLHLLVEQLMEVGDGRSVSGVVIGGRAASQIALTLAKFASPHESVFARATTWSLRSRPCRYSQSSQGRTFHSLQNSTHGFHLIHSR
jgi:hypothetical protein